MVLQDPESRRCHVPYNWFPPIPPDWKPEQCFNEHSHANPVHRQWGSQPYQAPKCWRWALLRRRLVLDPPTLVYVEMETNTTSWRDQDKNERTGILWLCSGLNSCKGVQASWREDGRRMLTCRGLTSGLNLFRALLAGWTGLQGVTWAGQQRSLQAPLLVLISPYRHIKKQCLFSILLAPPSIAI